MASECEERVNFDTGAKIYTAKLDVTIDQRLLLLLELQRISVAPHRRFLEMRDKIAEIESWISLAVEIEIQEIESIAVNNHLIMVEITVNGSGASRWHGGGKALDSLEKKVQS